MKYFLIYYKRFDDKIPRSMLFRGMNEMEAKQASNFEYPELTIDRAEFDSFVPLNH